MLAYLFGNYLNFIEKFNMKFTGYNLKNEEIFSFDTDKKTDDELEKFEEQFFSYKDLELLKVTLELEPNSNVEDFNEAIERGDGVGTISHQKLYFNV